MNILKYRSEDLAKSLYLLHNKQPNEKWFEFRNQDEEKKSIELIIYDYIGWPFNDAHAIIRMMATFSNYHLIVRINSHGGDAFDGIAINNALRSHPGGVTTRVEGLAASAASIIFVAGQNRQMCDGSMIMIHNASTCFCGNKTEFIEVAKILSKIDESLLDIYLGCGKKSKKKQRIRQMLSNETWMSASEAIDEDFADEIVTIPKSKKISNEFPFDVSNNNNHDNNDYCDYDRDNDDNHSHCDNNDEFYFDMISMFSGDLIKSMQENR